MDHPDLVKSFADRKLLVSDVAVDDEELTHVEESFRKKIGRPVILYLMLAQGCNCQCNYCPIPELAKENGDLLLPEDSAIAAVDLWLDITRRQQIDESFVIFYGGEPLLNKTTFQVTVEYIRSLRQANRISAQLQLLLVTNGVLIDESVIALCRDNAITVVIGLDGPNDANRLRVFPDGAESTTHALNAIHKLTAAGVRTCASVTVSPVNLRRVPEIASWLKSLGVSAFGFNFLRGRALLDFLVDSDLDQYHRKAAAAVINSFLAHGEVGFEYQINKKYRAFSAREFFPADCTCYGNQLVVQANSQMSHCPFVHAGLGDVRVATAAFDVASTSTVADWRRHLPFFNDAFDGCDAISLCGGGCAWGVRDSKGDIDEGMRAFAEQVFDELIWSELDA